MYVLAYFRHYRARRRQIEADAEALMREYGPRAMGEAKRRFLEHRPDGTCVHNDHWGEVRLVIKRRQGVRGER